MNIVDSYQQLVCSNLINRLIDYLTKYAHWYKYVQKLLVNRYQDYVNVKMLLYTYYLNKIQGEIEKCFK
jgi:hypothetical protein